MSEFEALDIDPLVYEEILLSTKVRGKLSLVERISRKTMVELVKSNRATFLFLKDDECRNWWDKIYNDASIKLEERKTQWRVYEIKQNAWDRLDPESRKVLGIRKPIKPRSPKP